MKYIHYGIILLNRVQTQKHQGLLSKLFSVNSLKPVSSMGEAIAITTEN
jgi:hypothetical protein